jgi:hypothetical protein
MLLSNFETIDHAQATIQPPSLGHGVGMGSDQDGLIGTGHLAIHVSNIIGDAGQTSFPKFSAQPLASQHVVGTIGGPINSGLVLTESRERAQVAQEPLRPDTHCSNHLTSTLITPADAAAARTLRGGNSS